MSLRIGSFLVGGAETASTASLKHKPAPHRTQKLVEKIGRRPENGV